MALRARTLTFVAVAALAACGGHAVRPVDARVEVHGQKLAVRCSGSGSPSVVFDEALTFDSTEWAVILPRVAKITRACAYDRLGEGRSDRVRAGVVQTVADQAGTLSALLDKAGIAPPYVLVGHSWGGAVALHLATATDLVTRLVLEDPAIGQRHPNRERRALVEEGFVGQVGLSRIEAEQRARANLELGWSAEDVAGKVDAATKGSPAAVRAVFDENRPWELHPLLPALR